ncbi:GntR family transcriptional regulator [Rhizobiaceae bacterium n13]|uniref:GntR family transcriptional regulator n=1 Tax=Ferirhizobium litorale TaxID=2927786 RepID=A0AAE3QFY5_9HYPH|nr:GntR family transcriptional regulator [Fererhizobium litorale]MDI7863124.1 GntR family transcriptional regulator [Fererhizobium litorale]MDI7923198.1 GntR family transcriptional regulator [Fererhizobium litorale]
MTLSSAPTAFARPAPLPAAGLKRTSTSHQLHELLRGRIISLELPPGMQLSRNDLAAFYGVSQTPVRDALQMLEKEGLVIVFPQSRTEVTRIDLAQARETQFLRMSLELEVVRALACEAGQAAVAQVERIVQLQDTALNVDGDMDRFGHLDRQFHQAMFEAVGVPDLWMLVQSRSGHIDRLRKLNLMDPGKAATILAAHQEIIAHMKAFDVAGAQDAVRRHLSGTLAKVDDIRRVHTQYF